METKRTEKPLLSNFWEKVRALFTNKSPRDEHLVTLISVATDNPAIRDQLLSVLSQEPFQRQSLINTWLEDLQIAGAPVELRSAMTELLDEDIADRAYSLLNAI